MVIGGDDRDSVEAVEMDEEVPIVSDEGVTLPLVANLASTPVGCAGLLPCVTGAWSAALATPGGARTEVRGLLSIMAQTSGD